ncbi:MAG: IS1595 family transposase [candidate division NC10 bacterium]
MKATNEKHFEEGWCFERLQQIRWPSGITCPRCHSMKVTVHSRSCRSPRRKYLCRRCRRVFTDLTGTPMARTNLDLRTWFLCLRLMESVNDTAELARKLGVKWETADKMRRKLAATSRNMEIIRKLNRVVWEAPGG